VKDERLYLVHILECIELIEEYLNSGWEAYLTSRLIQDGVHRRLQIMGESTQRLSPATKAAHPEIPWTQIAGMRNIMAHGYFDLDDEKIRYTIEHDLSMLKRVIAILLVERQIAEEPAP